MRSLLSLLASALAGLGAIASTWSFATTFVPLYVGLTFVGGLQAAAAHSPFSGPRAWLSRGIALAWLAVALIAVALLAMQTTMLGASGPLSAPEPRLLGLPATTHRALGLFGGALLSSLSAWLPARWTTGEQAFAREQVGRP